MRGMCGVALAHRVHPDWPLILIGNRDEFHARAAAPLHQWDDGSGLVAGRDLQAGGTWLGVPRPSGRTVVVTNVRGATPDPAQESRGTLVSDLLRGDGPLAGPAADTWDERRVGKEEVRHSRPRWWAVRQKKKTKENHK